MEDLLEVFAGLTCPDDVFALLEDLFTVREIKDTSQRLDVARMLRKGSSYAVIEKATGASATTIARVSKALNYGAGGYGLAFEVLDAKEAEGGKPLNRKTPQPQAKTKKDGNSCVAPRSRQSAASLLKGTKSQ